MDQLKPISTILPKEEFDKLKAIQNELKDTWHKRQVFRTETEIRYAVLNDFKFPTKASKYWQAVREQMVHFDELTRLSFDIRRKEIDLLDVQDKIKYSGGSIKERLEIERDEILFELACSHQIAKDRVREIIQWSQIKQEINDGSFDDKDANTHQRESLFKSVLNHARVAQKDISSEERLSIEGILYGLKDEPANKELINRFINKDSNGKTKDN